jgi:hypothetical protein
MQIAPVACERQISDILRAAVLLRDDVLNMMSQLAVLLAQTAVFAPLVSAAVHQVPRCRIHLLLNCRLEV